MAMSGDATDWAHFYALGSHPSSTSPMFGHGPAESTVVTTSAAAAVTAATAAAAASGCGPQMGRAGKTARRRSRASRRAPTTLLNTDTANFRAMVQQFTGIPSGPPQAHLPPPAGPVINFGPVFGDSARPAPTVVSFGHLQHHQQQQPYMDQFHYSRPVFTQDLYNNNNNNSNNNNNNNNNKNDQDIYVYGGSNSVSSAAAAASQAEMSEGFIFDGVNDQMMLHH